MKLFNTIKQYKFSTKLLKTLLVILVLSSNLFAQCQSSDGEKLPYDLTEVGLDSLLNMELEVTSPAKKPQSLQSAPSALFVLTGKDIRRSGATHIADALRLVPGVNVAQVNGNQWAITIRGLNHTFARNVLVMLDGQSIFTPGFNGVFWDQHDIDLMDIDRIEVIRGPGASVWGSNAVNGVINIITCSARGTQGTRVTIGGGTKDTSHLSMRYGGNIDQHTHYRIHAKLNQKNDNKFIDGTDANDGYDHFSAGFRLDKELNEKDELMFVANTALIDKNLNFIAPSVFAPYTDSETYSGDKEQYVASFVSKFTRNYSESESAFAQLDYTFEKQGGNIFPLIRHTATFETQHRFSPLKNHDFIYGLSLRINKDDIEGNFADDFDPETRTTHLFTAFFHDNISFFDNKLNLTLGSKFEYNSYTHFEYMPNARLLWKAKESTSLWVSAARAVAIPSRVFDDVIIPVSAFPDQETGLTVLPTVFGSDNIESENLFALEMGLRSQLTKTSSIDIALFYNEYGDYQTFETGMPFVGTLRDQTTPAIIAPLIFGNGFEIQTYGFEVASSHELLPWWKVHSAYSFINIDVDTGNSTDTTSENFYSEGSPQQQAVIRSQINIGENIEFDTTLRFVDQIKADNIDAYTELDVRLAYLFDEKNQITLTGFNLLEDNHSEFKSQVFQAPLVRLHRTFFLSYTHWF